MKSPEKVGLSRLLRQKAHLKRICFSASGKRNQIGQIEDAALGSAESAQTNPKRARQLGGLRLVARKTISLLMAALSLILTASHSHAGLGWTLLQFKEQYGEPVLNQELIAGRIGYVFNGKDYIIAAFFLNRQASRILYICRSGSVFSWARARALLKR